MIRKIICPTDLSPAAQNAVSYAAKLCQATGASLELFHAEPVYTNDMFFDSSKKAYAIASFSEELEKQCKELNKIFGITCSAFVETDSLPLDEAVSRKADEETLIVAGTNGADNLFQRVFGSNAFNIARQAYTNVLVIPEGVEFATIGTIAFAWDYEIPQTLIRKVNQLAGQLDSKLIFVHVSTHASEISKDVFRALSERIAETTGKKERADCDRLFGSDIRGELNRYMKEKHVDVLAISIKKGRLVRKAFHQSGGAGSLPGYPLLIIHSRKPGPFY